jgi:hypothetical protein
VKTSRPKRPAEPKPAADYDRDFFAWTQATSARLRTGRFDELDVENAAAEIEDMGKRDLKELNSRTQILLQHLLKWRLQADKRSASWRATIVTQRIEIEALLRDSPSLAAQLRSELARNYAGAVKRAVAETELDRDEFPAKCPFTLAQLLDEEFLPE